MVPNKEELETEEEFKSTESIRRYATIIVDKLMDVNVVTIDDKDAAIESVISSFNYLMEMGETKRNSTRTEPMKGTESDGGKRKSCRNKKKQKCKSKKNRRR